ncbi:MAG: hypothetical protein ACLUHE_17045 [Christensenellales bacterium]
MHALCLNDALDATLVTVPRRPGRGRFSASGHAGTDYLADAEDGVLCATEGFLHAVSRDGMRLLARGACARARGRSG